MISGQYAAGTTYNLMNNETVDSHMHVVLNIQLDLGESQIQHEHVLSPHFKFLLYLALNIYTLLLR